MKYMSLEIYNKVVDYYWCTDFKRKCEYIPTNFTFSVKEPSPVGNPQMHWRRPTYEELNWYNNKLWKGLLSGY